MSVTVLKRDRVDYKTLEEVELEIPNDEAGESLRFQYVFPIENGIAYPQAASYRFIRYSPRTERLKPQMGQAQVQEFVIMVKLIAMMAKKRKMKIPKEVVQMIVEVSE